MKQKLVQFGAVRGKKTHGQLAPGYLISKLITIVACAGYPRLTYVMSSAYLKNQTTISCNQFHVSGKNHVILDHFGLVIVQTRETAGSVNPKCSGKKNYTFKKKKPPEADDSPAAIYSAKISKEFPLNHYALF